MKLKAVKTRAVVSAPEQYRAARDGLSGFLHIPDLLEN